MSKLVKPGDPFTQSVPHGITILSPIAPHDIACHVTIIVNKYTSAVELSSVPADLLYKDSVIIDLLQLAILRVKDIHRGKTHSEIVLPQ